MSDSQFHPEAQVCDIGGIRFVWTPGASVWVCQACGGHFAQYTEHAVWHLDMDFLKAHEPEDNSDE